jgi:N-acetylglucosaminyl-diphospho-decaprenol L-rhamnosyltransferase
MTETLKNAGTQLSIIIVSWQVKNLVLDCINSVYQHTKLSRKHYEIIVVDNASDDGTVTAVREKYDEITVIENKKNVGFGVANNQAYDRCSGRYILLLNPDTLLLDDAIGKMLQYMENHEDVSALGCRLLNTDHSLQRWTAGAFPSIANAAAHYLFLNRFLPSFLKIPPLYLEQDIQYDKEVDWVSGACMILRRDDLGSTIFDPSFFMYGEDMELCHRLKEAGGVIAYYPGASIVHFQGKSMEQQEGEILLQALKGPRNFYTTMHGASFSFLFDFLAVAGFFLRWVIYGILSLVRPNETMRRKEKLTRHHLVVGFKVLFRQ